MCTTQWQSLVEKNQQVNLAYSNWTLSRDVYSENTPIHTKLQNSKLSLLSGFLLIPLLSMSPLSLLSSLPVHFKALALQSLCDRSGLPPLRTSPYFCSENWGDSLEETCLLSNWHTPYLEVCFRWADLLQLTWYSGLTLSQQHITQEFDQTCEWKNNRNNRRYSHYLDFTFSESSSVKMTGCVELNDKTTINIFVVTTTIYVLLFLHKYTVNLPSCRYTFFTLLFSVFLPGSLQLHL